MQIRPSNWIPRSTWVHRSTIVNLAHLAGTRRNDASRLFLRVKGFDAELPASRAYMHLFKAMQARYSQKPADRFSACR